MVQARTLAHVCRTVPGGVARIQSVNRHTEQAATVAYERANLETTRVTFFQPLSFVRLDPSKIRFNIFGKHPVVVQARTLDHVCWSVNGSVARSQAGYRRLE